MGCCISSTAKRARHYSPPKREPKRSIAAIVPPPASLEEETVKEVLSETPIIPKPPQTPPLTLNEMAQIPIVQEPKLLRSKRKDEEKENGERTPEISQASEIYSVADTYSTATTATTTTTTTVTEIKDDEVTSKRRLNRSPAKVPRKRPYTGERDRLPKSSVRRERPPASKRELTGQTRVTQQRNVEFSRVGRDQGERSGRRSRSPATRNSAGGGVKGRGRASPGKLIGESGSKPAEVAVGTGAEKEEDSGNDNVSMQQTGSESPDSPHVSLECFIFL